jgi:hypothetical protein
MDFQLRRHDKAAIGGDCDDYSRGEDYHRRDSGIWRFFKDMDLGSIPY